MIQWDTLNFVTGSSRSEIVYGLTSLSPEKASPGRLLGLNRGHWGIENDLHWVRDVVFDEDRCRIRRGAGAQVMASLRNLVLTLSRLAGACRIAPALHACARHCVYPLRQIGVAMA